jgi:LysM repeat protein
MAASNEPGFKPDSASTGQLRFFQATTILLAILLLGGAGYYYYRQHASQPMTILVNGAPTATVQNLTAAVSLVRLVHTEQVGPEYFGRDNPRFTEPVEFQKASDQTPIDSTDAAESKVAAATHTVVDADVILVDHKKIIALPDAQTAQDAVDELRSHYASMPPPGDPIEKPTFVQNVTIDRQVVPASLTKRNADDAAALLWTPPPPQTYTVQLHETGWSIARKFKLQFGDFLRANAGSNVNRLAPGDTVIVSKTFPPVDVIVKKQEQKTETFGGSGVRQLTVEETYIDGVLTGTPIATSMITLQRATPRRSLD